MRGFSTSAWARCSDSHHGERHPTAEPREALRSAGRREGSAVKRYNAGPPRKATGPGWRRRGGPDVSIRRKSCLSAEFEGLTAIFDQISILYFGERSSENRLKGGFPLRSPFFVEICRTVQLFDEKTEPSKAAPSYLDTIETPQVKKS